jgi:thiol-disulfide isomerase/thioredoxin
MLCMVALLLCLSCFVYGQELKQLKVGDHIPGFTISNVINAKKDKVVLGTKPGRLIIIDFWGKYCGPCIMALPKLDSLQAKFGNRVQIISVSDFENREEAIKTIQKYDLPKDFKLPVALDNKQLKTLFPFLLVSHVVWIDENGIVVALTGTEYVTESNIEKVLKKEKLNWPIKNDVLTFDYKKPFLEINRSNSISSNQLYYSSFVGNVGGIAPPLGFETDSVNNFSYVQYFNYNMLVFCKMVFEYPRVSYNPKTADEDFILNVKDKSRFIKPANIPEAEWNLKNTYGYYAKLPTNISREEMISFVKADLVKWLSVMGVSVKQEIVMKNNEAHAVYTITEKDNRL